MYLKHENMGNSNDGEDDDDAEMAEEGDAGGVLAVGSKPEDDYSMAVDKKPAVSPLSKSSLSPPPLSSSNLPPPPPLAVASFAKIDNDSRS
jgi:hypothetical protein